MLNNLLRTTSAILYSGGKRPIIFLKRVHASSRTFARSRRLATSAYTTEAMQDFLVGVMVMFLNETSLDLLQHLRHCARDWMKISALHLEALGRRHDSRNHLPLDNRSIHDASVSNLEHKG